MKFAICNELFEGWAFGDICRFVKTAGYDGLELAPFTLATPISSLSRAKRREIRETAADAGLAIVGLHWLLAKTVGFHVTSPDERVRERTARYLGVLAEACAELGGHVMVFGSPTQRTRPPGVTAEDALRFAVDTFQQAMPRVEAAGVKLCMEPLTRDETDFINTCAEAAALADAVAHPSFVLHLDVKAMSSETTPIPELIARYAPRAGHFHANDPNRGGPGFGRVDFAPIFHALAEVGYDRWVSVEVFDFTPGPETIAVRSLEYMRRCLS